MSDLVLMPDMQLWAIGFLRARLAERSEPVCSDVEVDRVEPSVQSRDFPQKLVVVGDNGNIDRDLVLADASLRVSVLAGSREDPSECIELARIVHAIMRGCARPRSPVAAVIASRGPMAVPEAHPRARRLSTFDLSIVGTALS